VAGLLVHIYQKEKIALRNGSEIARVMHIINVQLSMHMYVVCNENSICWELEFNKELMFCCPH
jgi:hypothetical protein